jgi:Protein of unknown function (DUF4233)
VTGVRFLCAAVLAFEAVVAALGIAPAMALANVDPGVAVGGGLGIATACVVAAASLPRRWAYVAGSVLQAVVILTGLVVPGMAIVGVVFAALWVTAIYLGGRVERIRRERGIADR